ncbi:MAG: gamma-glutamyltransferase [Rhodothermia bacterium]|nr:MAG: gamma-glutamyltransferase [Rhodothermia bacterium]
MVATSQPLASLVAVEILNAGGTAVDAAIAANAMLALVEPIGCGPGGDLFAMVWDPDAAKLIGLNASGRSPCKLTLEILSGSVSETGEIPVDGPLSVSVPGCVSGWSMLHERFGRLEIGRLLAPAIQTSRRGFPVTKVVAREWAVDLERIREADKEKRFSSNLLSTFARGGRSPASGETFTNPDLADTLEEISDGGLNAFYQGRIAETIGNHVERVGGFLSAQDLSDHRSDWVEPLSVNYRGFEVFELPPNGQGITALQMLNILDGVNLLELGPNSANALHQMIEAKKLTFEDRSRLYADPEFSHSPIEALLSPKRARAHREMIQPDAALTCSAAWLPIDQHGDTCYLTTADSDGMMVSLMQSNFSRFGSGLVPDGLGFGIQNRGALFSLDPEHPNVFEPGKRPFHTIIPAFVLEQGEPILSFGVMGGAMQPQGQIQILTNLIDFDMGLQEAGDALRWRHAGSSRPTGIVCDDAGVLILEEGFDQHVSDELERKGHVIKSRTGIFGGYQAIAVDRKNGVFIGASDRRKDGMALGL